MRTSFRVDESFREAFRVKKINKINHGNESQSKLVREKAEPLVKPSMQRKEPRFVNCR